MIDQFIKQLGSGLEQAANTLGKLPAEEIQLQLQQVEASLETKPVFKDEGGIDWIGANSEIYKK